ncbi:MAG: DUF1517 domain-containing protein [Microcoleus vaginatus WJT46-NPBG5]|nr:DUF1517 domain-containing protein [Microcoleus vaginatus WJT46-NPBG5]
MKKFQFIWISLLSFLLINEVNFNPSKGEVGKWVEFNSAAYARRGSTGGRSRGGSFSRPSSPSRPSSGNSAPRNSFPSQSAPAPANSSGSSNTGGRVRGGSFQPPAPAPVPYNPPRSTGTTNYPPNYYPARQADPYYPRGGGTVIVPVPVPVGPGPYYSNPGQAPYYPPADPSVSQPNPNYQGSGYSSSNRSTSSSGSFWSFLLFLLVCGSLVFLAWYIFAGRKKGNQNELTNDIVTVSKLQVALLAEARHIQSHLSDLSLSADLDSSEGLTQLLQESALALLRSPEYWTHVRASSQTVQSREEAAQLFEQLSIEERSKFSAETLSNVGGNIRYGDRATANAGDELATYIVVTFLVGTENDNPLFDSIHSAEELQQTLQRVASISPEYLLIFELLWSPQKETDTLSYDQLLTEYSDMILIA